MLLDNLILKRNMVLIEPIPPDQRTASGIHLGFQSGQSDLLRECYPSSGKVVKLGPEIPPEITLNALVHFARWGAEALEIEEKTYLLLHIRDILMVEGV